MEHAVQTADSVSDRPRGDNTSELTVNVFAAIDEGFAMPLAVTIRSALDNLRSADHVRFVVATVGVSEQSRRKLARVVSKADVQASIDFVAPDMTSISDLPTSNWYALPIYVPLLMGELVPRGWDRVIYLDGDIVVRDDLGPLWERPMNGNIVQGVPDFRSPTVAQRLSLRDAYLDDLGLPSDTVYCNTGLMVVDLDAWREENVGPRCVEFVRKYAHLVEYPDQDALNGVIAGRWEVLDPTWQVALSALHYYGFPHHESSENRREQARLKREAKMVHYSGASKPWHFLYRRSLSAEFFDYLVESGWFGAWKARFWTWPRRLAHVALRLLPDTALDMARRALSHVKTRLK